MADSSNIEAIFNQSIVETTNKIQVTEFMKLEKYETFKIEDYVSKEFYVNSIDDIKVSKGTVKLETTSDGIQKIIWTVTDSGEFSTGESATMSIKTTFLGELDSEHVYPTNQKEEIITKLEKEDKKVIISELTPKLRGGYTITYDLNLPSKCNLDGKDLTAVDSAFPYNKLELPKNEYTCPGWQFKDWQFSKENGVDISDNQFIMPSRDIKVSAIWTRVGISKNMDGTVHKPLPELIEAMKENEEKSIDVDTGINFGLPSSETNGRGLYIRSETESDTNPIYYYRGAVENNNVLFAGICWQIVRTTETGGIKLIYNGESSNGKTCDSTGDTYIEKNVFDTNPQSAIYRGYMRAYDDAPNANFYTETITQTRRWSTSVSYSNGIYTLNSSKYSKEPPDDGYYYACIGNRTATTCSEVMYFITGEKTSTTGFTMKTIKFSGGETMDTLKSKNNSSAYNYSSTSKIRIDNWYKVNIDDKGYTKYLEDTVWCNDTKIVNGIFSSSNTKSSLGASDFAATGTRHLNSTSANPSVKMSAACRVGDQFTTKNSSIGNKALTYPIGMLTADEVLLSGIISGRGNQDSYLYTGYSYLTMTPHYLGSDLYSYYYAVGYSGILTDYSVGSALNIRPSISLKPETLVYGEGNGTLEHPYEVVVE